MRILDVLKVSIIALCTLIIVGCGGGIGPSEAGVSSGLLGSWEYTHGNQCKSTYTFNGDLTWTLASLDEEMTGTYTLSDLEDTNRAQLDLVVSTDNGLADCEGVSDIDTGVTEVYYIEISNNQMNWYTNVNDTNSDLTLIK